MNGSLSHVYHTVPDTSALPDLADAESLFFFLATIVVAYHICTLHRRLKEDDEYREFGRLGAVGESV